MTGLRNKIFSSGFQKTVSQITQRMTFRHIFWSIVFLFYGGGLLYHSQREIADLWRPNPLTDSVTSVTRNRATNFTEHHKSIITFTQQSQPVGYRNPFCYRSWKRDVIAASRFSKISLECARIVECPINSSKTWTNSTFVYLHASQDRLSSGNITLEWLDLWSSLSY